MPGIFAAGDVANAWHPVATAAGSASSTGTTRSARAGSRPPTMLGRGQSYDRTPYFYSDQYDLGMEYRGLASAGDEVVFRGDPDGREFVALLGCATVGSPRR